MEIIISIITFLLIILYLIFFCSRKRLTLIDCFVASLTFYQVGACMLVFDVGWNNASTLVLYSSSLCFIVGCVFGALLRQPVAAKLTNIKYRFCQSVHTLDRQLVKISAAILILLNCIIVVVVVVKFNDLFLSMHSGALLDIRKQISSGGRGFLAPGLIKQVRDLISPGIICYIFLFFTKREGRILGVLLFLSVLIATLIGGQRFPIVVLFMSMSIVYFYLQKQKGKSKTHRKNIFLYSGIMLMVLIILNFLLGRLNEEGSYWDMLYGTCAGLINRIFLMVPNENYLSINYIKSLNFADFQIWIQELASILPGFKNTLANDLHSHLGGSSQGNSVLGAPISAYMNFGYWGVVLFPTLVILMLYKIEMIVVGSRLLYAYRIVLFFQVPLWYSPFLMILNGGLVFLFVVFRQFLYGIFFSSKKIANMECSLLIKQLT